MNTASTFALQLGATVVIAAALVRAVMWRLGWLEHRTITARMKRGEASRLWSLAPVVPIAVTAAWWAGSPDLARLIVALTAGAPFLFATERLWIGSELR